MGKIYIIKPIIIKLIPIGINISGNFILGLEQNWGSVETEKGEDDEGTDEDLDKGADKDSSECAALSSELLYSKFSVGVLKLSVFITELALGFSR